MLRMYLLLRMCGTDFQNHIRSYDTVSDSGGLVNRTPLCFVTFPHTFPCARCQALLFYGSTAVFVSVYRGDQKKGSVRSADISSVPRQGCAP